MFPMQMMINMFGGHPMFKRAQQMSKGRSDNQIEEVCRNVCKQRGFDYDQMKQQFQQQVNMMQRNMPK